MNDQAYIIHVPLPERLQGKTMKSLARAWTSGYVARMANIPMSDCPYLKGGPHRCVWYEGWNCSDNDTRGNNIRANVR